MGRCIIRIRAPPRDPQVNKNSLINNCELNILQLLCFFSLSVDQIFTLYKEQINRIKITINEFHQNEKIR